MLQAQLNFFPIGTNSAAMGCAFDGSNYLVAMENHQAIPTTVGAQMLSLTGGKVGTLIPTGRTGIAPAVAFDGANYLLTWEDDGLGAWNKNTGWQVYGQFIDKAGQKVGSPFAISTVGVWVDGIKTTAFGNGKYLVTYTRLINPQLGEDSQNSYVAGRIVNPDGTMGNEFRISTGYGKTAEVAFDGNNFFVVWREDSADYEIRGRFVSPAGMPGREISVNASVAPSDNPLSVAFGDSNYFVIWSDEVGGSGTREWDVFGQLVTPNGDLVGGVVPVTIEPGPQLPTSLAFGRGNYLAVWVDMQNGSNWDAYGQFISRTGTLLGGKLPLSTEPGNEMPFAGYAGENFFLGVAHGVVMGEGGLSQVSYVVGTLLTPPAEPRITLSDGSFGFRTNRFGFNLTGMAGQTVVVETCTSLTQGGWQPVYTNTFTSGPIYFSDATWTNQLGRFYRLRLP